MRKRKTHRMRTGRQTRPSVQRSMWHGVHRKSLTSLSGRKGSTDLSASGPSQSLSQEGAELPDEVDTLLACRLSSSRVASSVCSWEEPVRSRVPAEDTPY